MHLWRFRLPAKSKTKSREEAALWFARMHAPDAAPELVEEFETWLTASPENIDAYTEVRRFWNVSRTLIKGISPLNFTNERTNRIRNYSTLAWLAAILLVAVGLSTIIMSFILISQSKKATTTASIIPIADREYSADAQNGSSIFLPDGSLVVLNASSKMRVRYTTSVREITLKSGRALFEVAKHKSQPFLVYAGDRRVVATGTAFDVSLDQSRKSVSVTLMEGSVIVDRPNAKANQEAMRIKLEPGERLVSSYGSPPQVSTSSPDRETNWHMDRMVFSESPLSVVVAALNRYGGTQIVLSDNKLGDLRIDGTLRSDNPIAVAHAIAAIYSLRIVEENPKVVRLDWR